MSVSDDRADELADWEGQPEESTDVAAPASAAARRERPVGRSTHPAGRAEGKGKDHPTRPRGATDTKVSLPGKAVRFLREVVAELRKVIWPTRKQLVTYTTVVLVFVSVMVTYVALLDLGFGKAVFYVFG
ncbi:MAG TPA: preprotein translocase subunit SecE [Pseudonocardiaceae bacterium]